MRMAAGHRVTHRVFRRARIVNRIMPHDSNRGQSVEKRDFYILCDSEGYEIYDSENYQIVVTS